jgi:hypothetical protein
MNEADGALSPYGDGRDGLAELLDRCGEEIVGSAPYPAAMYLALTAVQAREVRSFTDTDHAFDRTAPARIWQHDAQAKQWIGWNRFAEEIRLNVFGHFVSSSLSSDTRNRTTPALTPAPFTLVTQ